MFPLLALFGFGLLFAGLIGDDDDDQPAGETGTDEGGSSAETFTDGVDVVLDQTYLPMVQADAADLVAEGELTQAEADAALANINLRSGAVNISTGNGNDYVATGKDNDTITTGDGDDYVIGGRGNDLINLGAGDDVYGVDPRGVSGNDDYTSFPNGGFELFGPPSALEGGNDTILGGSGADWISDSFGSNVVNGQQGNDFISVVDEEAGGANTPDVVNGGFGNDTIYVDKGDIVTGNQGRDQITVDVFGGVSDGYDFVTIADFEPGRDTLELEGSFGLLLTPSPTGPEDVPVNPISVADLEDGSGAVVSINGIPVVRVIGGAGMTVADVQLSV